MQITNVKASLAALRSACLASGTETGMEYASGLSCNHDDRND